MKAEKVRGGLRKLESGKEKVPEYMKASWSQSRVCLGATNAICLCVRVVADLEFEEVYFFSSNGAVHLRCAACSTTFHHLVTVRLPRPYTCASCAHVHAQVALRVRLVVRVRVRARLLVPVRSRWRLRGCARGCGCWRPRGCGCGWGCARGASGT